MKSTELEKITHKSVVNGRKVFWSNASDYLKVSKLYV